MARARLQVDEQEAQRRDDLAALARVSLLQSTNSYFGAQEVGADAAVLTERRQQVAADEAALRLTLRAEAAREAKALGKTGAAAEAHIAGFEAERMQAVHDEQAALAAGRDVRNVVGRNPVEAENIARERQLAERNEVSLGQAPLAETAESQAEGFEEMAALIGPSTDTEEIGAPLSSAAASSIQPGSDKSPAH